MLFKKPEATAYILIPASNSIILGPGIKEIAAFFHLSRPLPPPPDLLDYKLPNKLLRNGGQCLILLGTVFVRPSFRVHI